ncbi:MAG: hypothetical protein J7M21_04680, partial [Planctomycetes bacterium]|nr:hypothetical protein [Planctomycetota bacterium]
GGKGYVSLLVMGENLLVLAENGQLLLIPADPKGFRVVAKTRVCGRNWCNPAYADGKLYLRDADRLMCIELLRPAGSGSTSAGPAVRTY